MQNEISPRRTTDKKVSRRGVQQAGRIGRANDKRGRSFCGLRRHRLADLIARLPGTLRGTKRTTLLFSNDEFTNSLFSVRPNSTARPQTLDQSAVFDCKHAKAETAYAGLRHESINFFKNRRAHIGTRTRNCVYIQYT